MSYRIFGSENSPYSLKVRSYFRYSGLNHQWVVRTMANEEEFSKYAKLPIVPCVVTPEDKGIQDSTRIIEHFEKLNTCLAPSVAEDTEGVITFLSELFEEFGDEWLNKYMFHYRWAREVDQVAVSKRLAMDMTGMSEEDSKDVAGMIMQRMSGRGFTVGSNEKTSGIIEDLFKGFLPLMEAHLASRPFIFGGKPSLADFGMGPQIYQALIDPTAGEIIRSIAPKTAAWCEKMSTDTWESSPSGEIESLEQLVPTLAPLLSQQVSTFLAWSNSNALAIANGEKEMSVSLKVNNNQYNWWQAVGGPQKYQAKTLKEIRRKFASSPASSNTKLVELLQKTNCLEYLQQQTSKL